MKIRIKSIIYISIAIFLIAISMIINSFNIGINKAEISEPEAFIIYETNIARTQFGLPELKTDYFLSYIADQRIKEMNKNNYFGHISPEGKSFKDTINENGYKSKYVGENLAKNYQAEDVVTAWLNSEKHRDNILNKKFTKIGVSVGEKYIVQLFAE